MTPAHLTRLDVLLSRLKLLPAVFEPDKLTVAEWEELMHLSAAASYHIRMAMPFPSTTYTAEHYQGRIERVLLDGEPQVLDTIYAISDGEHGIIHGYVMENGFPARDGNDLRRYVKTGKVEVILKENP